MPLFFINILYNLHHIYDLVSAPGDNMILTILTSFIFLYWQGILGMKATSMITELIRDNRMIVDRVGNNDIDNVIHLVKQNQVSQYGSMLDGQCLT